MEKRIIIPGERPRNRRNTHVKGTFCRRLRARVGGLPDLRGGGGVHERLREQHPRDEIEELTLAGLGLAYFTGKELEYRDALLARGGQADDYFKLARQFAAADKIVIAAPYWDLSFPALLKVYIERVSVSGITFSPEPDGRLRGLCRGEKMLLITTSGGDFTHEDLTLYGTALSYLRGICAMFGVDGFDYLWTHGLDIVGNDPEAILRGAKKQAAAFAESW